MSQLFYYVFNAKIHWNMPKVYRNITGFILYFCELKYDIIHGGKQANLSYVIVKSNNAY